MTQTHAKDQPRDEAPDATPEAEETVEDTTTGAEDAQSSDGADAPAVEDDPGARIAELEAEVARLNREYLGALAEAQNTKRMADKRIQDNSKYAVSNLAKAILPVADNMDRALAAAPQEAREADPHLKNLAVGVEMTAKELLNALGQYGVKRIEAMNQPFDPNLHQAMQEMENQDVPAGTVVQVFQDGYVIHDRLLRPAMVVVSKGGPKRQAPVADASQAEGGAGGQGLDTSV
ncbi:nucleotide exchange factor GrpE [Rhodospira trueperi]|uniref:Protein GrpE n=1 Tax=Rhodospira trueperi TaxID=69960 RepID=A0A1G7BRP3_9PROT|nr:nucleotide exchange factor GrpE [Rhodospira trueperi]SDE29758.1 molecular chaperone GrpE [Rhodospira trueperi]